jgi:DNA-binding GntR family transcriptional regulator
MSDVNMPFMDSIKVPLVGVHAPAAQPRTLVERAYLAMRQDIIQGLLEPGERLRVEHLKDRYDVGAGTLREALALLVSDAMVKVEGQRGYKVAPISLDDLKDLTDTRVLLETSALRQSIRLGDAQWEQELRQTFDALSHAEENMDTVDPVSWELANKRFHEALISAYCSPWSQRLLDILYRHGERYRRVAIRMGAAQTIHRDVHAEHSSIFTAAVARQEARAALALEAHIRLTCDLLQHQDFQMDADGQVEKIVCT